MKRPLIVIEQENLIMCDNINCDYVIPKESDDPYESIDKYLNMPCPKCRHNLLTEDDLNKYKQATSIVKFINKWFGWLSIFSSKKTEYKKLGSYHTRKGLIINDDDKQS